MQATRSLLVCLTTLALSAASRAQLNQSWVDRYNGTDNHADYFAEMDSDGQGNLYVVGSTRVDISPNSNVPVLLTMKYDVAGNREWSHTFGFGVNNSGFGSDVAVAPNGDVIVAGSVNNSRDWAVLRYDPAGNLLWSAVYDVLYTSFLTQPDGMVIDSAGNIYLVGYLGSFSGALKATVVKFDAAGNQLWVFQHSSGLLNSSAAALDVDGAGNVYLTGTVEAGNASDLSLMKLDSAGFLQWLRTYGHSNPQAYDRGVAMAIDGAGDIVVCGVIGSNTSSGTDVVTLKFDPAGNQLWASIYDGPAASSDYGSRLAIDPNDNVLVVGTTRVTFSDEDGLLLKYAPSGVLEWERQYAGAAQALDSGWDVDVDLLGRATMVGQVYTLTGAGEYYAVRYDKTGAKDWEALYGGPLSGWSTAMDVEVDRAGNVFVSGESDGFSSSSDIATIRYSNTEHTRYCTAKLNSLGCEPTIGAMGTPSASKNAGFLVTCTLVRNNKAGLMLYSASGRAAAAFQGGTLCLTPPIKRTPGAFAGGNPAPANDCSGAFVIDMNAFAAGLGGGNPLPGLSIPGTTVDCQWWGRDQGFPAPDNTMLSDGLEYLVTP